MYPRLNHESAANFEQISSLITLRPFAVNMHTPELILGIHCQNQPNE